MTRVWGSRAPPWRVRSCLSRLRAAVAVLAFEIPGRDGVFTSGAFEDAEAMHQLDGVMSHSFNCRRSTSV